MKEDESASLTDYFEVVIKWRKFIIRNVFIATVVTIIISLVLIQRFTATATILPPTPEQNMMLGLLNTGMPAGFSSFTGMGGLLSGFTTPSDLYAAIMKSGRIMTNIIKKYDLKNEFKARTMTQTYNALNAITYIKITPEGIIAVSVTYKNKYLAADIANSYIEELDRFNTETAMTAGKKYRIFIEQRLKDTDAALAKAEEVLRDFQKKNRTVVLEDEIVSVIQTIAQLKSQIILLEVKKGALSQSSQADNPYLLNINRELDELKKQLAKIEFGNNSDNKKEFGAGFAIPFAKLPEASLEYARLLRDVKIQEVIYELMTQQYEQAKIMELKDTPTVQFLDRASPPERKSFPKRTLIVIIVFVASIVVNILIVFAIEYVNEEKEKEKSSLRRILYLLAFIKSDLQKLKQKFKK